CTFNKNIYEYYSPSKELDTKTYRLLGKCKHKNYSNIVKLKEGILKHVIYEEKDMSNDAKETAGKKKSSNGNSSKNEKESKQPMKNKYDTFKIKNLSHMEKKILKELDYLNFLKNCRTTRNKIYKGIVRKKYGSRLGLPLFLLVLLIIGLIVELSLGFTGKNGLLTYLGFQKSHLDSLFSNEESGASSAWMSALKWLLGSPSTDSTAITFISALIYYYKKVKKYKKIKLRKRKNEK
ncbi:Plasmodium exported protein (Pm-fam-a like), unknown function, partial [Plasmodium malariae]